MGIKLFIIFLAALIIDGLILPALLGFRESFLSLLVLIVLVLYLGPGKRSVVYGLFFAVILESFRGFGFGTLAAPFLLTVIVIYSAQKFLDIKYTYDTRFSPGKSVFIAVMSLVFVHIFSFFYKFGEISFDLFNLVISLTVLSEALVLVLVFNIIFNKKSYYVS